MRTRTTLFAFSAWIATLIAVYIAFDIFGQYFPLTHTRRMVHLPGQICLFICPEEKEKTFNNFEMIFFLLEHVEVRAIQKATAAALGRQFTRMKSNKFEWNVITIFIQRWNGPLNRRHEYIWECAPHNAIFIDMEMTASTLIQRKIVLAPFAICATIATYWYRGPRNSFEYWAGCNSIRSEMRVNHPPTTQRCLITISLNQFHVAYIVNSAHSRDISFFKILLFARFGRAGTRATHAPLCHDVFDVHISHFSRLQSDMSWLWAAIGRAFACARRRVVI